MSSSKKLPMNLFEKHKALIERAQQAINERTFYSAYPEHPKAYGEEAPKAGEEEYKNCLNNNFNGLLQGDAKEFRGEEVSPFTMSALGIKYPIHDSAQLIEKSKTAFKSWKKNSPQERAGALVETLEEIKKHFFAIAHATMHTTGQSYMMSFQASGPHSADRALEPIALGLAELTRFPENIIWEKPMGKFSVKLEKTFSPVPKGIGLVIGCSTFPIWNTLPGVFANLIAGNTVIIKPHPKAVLPIAIAVAAMQKCLKENGFDPCVVQLACDTSDELVTKKFSESPDIALIDYTGSTAFGDYVETIPNKTVFTEKAGVNSVILDSVNDLDAVMQNLAFSVSLYSGQMCTAPQNFFIPASGVKGIEKIYSYEEVVAKLKESILGITTNPKMGAGVFGSLQNEMTLQRAQNASSIGATVVLETTTVKNEEFISARATSPVLLEVKSDAHHIFERELFGPIAIAIKTNDTAESVKIAKEMARKHGALTCAAYTTDSATEEMIAEEMQGVFTPVTFNLTGPIWVNQHAAFSDFHVTGGNPAGNASFTNPEFVTRRFVWVGNRKLVV